MDYLAGAGLLMLNVTALGNELKPIAVWEVEKVHSSI